MSEHSQPEPQFVNAQPRNASPLSCLWVLLAAAVFTVAIAWLAGWWQLSMNEQLVHDNMLTVARAAHDYHEQLGRWPRSFENLAEYSLLLSPPDNPYTGQPTELYTGSGSPQAGQLSLHVVNMNGAPEDLVIVGYGLRPVPEERRADWAMLPGGVDPQRVLFALSVNALTPEQLQAPVQEAGEASEAADSWKTPEMH